MSEEDGMRWGRDAADEKRMKRMRGCEKMKRESDGAELRNSSAYYEYMYCLFVPLFLDRKEEER